MKRILSVLPLLALLVFAGSAMAYDQGEDVELCKSEGEYALLAPEVECGGEVVTAKVSEVMENEIVVQLDGGETVTLPINK